MADGVVSSFQKASQQVRGKGDLPGPTSIIDINPDDSLELGSEGESPSVNENQQYIEGPEGIADALALDRPNIKSANDYVLQEIKLSDGQVVPREANQAFLEMAFSKGIPQGDVQDLLSWYYKTVDDALIQEKGLWRSLKKTVRGYSVKSSVPTSRRELRLLLQWHVIMEAAS